MKNYIYLIILMLAITGCTQGPTDNNSLDTTPLLNNTVVPDAPILLESDFEITPVVETYTWVYRSHVKSVGLTLFEEEFHFLSEQERPFEVNTSYAQALVNEPWQEDTIKEIVDQLESYGLEDDETLLNGLQMVRAIPYNRTVERWTYPYETLFLNEGVCADKTFLAAAIAEEMDYGVAIFGYYEANHMVLGIKCEEEYAYWEDYCISDVTNGHHFVTDYETVDAANAAHLPDEPDYVWMISNGSIIFDASQEYTDKLELLEKRNQRDNLSSWLQEHEVILLEGKEDLDAYYAEILSTEYDTESEVTWVLNDYKEYQELYQVVLADYTLKYDEYQSLLKWFDAYYFAYGWE